jgi:hypothetical protein
VVKGQVGTVLEELDNDHVLVEFADVNGVAYAIATVPMGHRGSTLNPDFRPFSESAFSAGAGLKAMIAKVLWWHVCNSHLQT